LALESFNCSIRASLDDHRVLGRERYAHGERARARQQRPPSRPTGADHPSIGEGGNDRIYGGRDIDRLWGGTENDYLDTIEGVGGNDLSHMASGRRLPAGERSADNRNTVGRLSWWPSAST